MSLLEIHFHDSGFSLFGDSDDSSNAASKLRSRASEAASGDSDGDSSDTALGKLAMFGAVALVVVAGVAFNRLRSRRDRAAGEERSSGRLSVSPAE